MGLLDSIERRSNPENPSTSFSNPDAWLWDAFGARSASSGVSVTPNKALSLSAYFACINVISQTLAVLPKPVFERQERGRRKAYENPNYQMVDLQPNPEMTSVTFFEAMQSHVPGYGGAFMEIELNGRGEGIALWPLLPDRTSCELNKDGEKVFVTEIWENGSPRRVILPKHRVLHVPGLGYDGFNGYSIAALAREAVALGIAAEEFGARFYANGANMGMVATHPGSFKNPDARKRIRESLETMTTGLKNAHRIAVLEEGLKLEKLGIPQKDAQHLELRGYQVSEIARFFRMPLHKIQDMSAATNNNIEHQGIEFVSDCMLIHVRRWEQALNSHPSIFSQRTRGRFAFHFNLEGLLRGDLPTRYSAFAIGKQWGFLSTNDIREVEDMNPLEAQIGDRYLYPLNMGPADRMDEIIDAQQRAAAKPVDQSRSGTAAVEDQNASGAPAVRAPNPLLGAFRELLGDSLQRLIRREAAEIRRLLPVWRAKRRSTEEISAEVATIHNQLRDAAGAILAPLERAFPSIAPIAFASSCAERYVQDSAAQITPILRGNGDTLAALESRLAEWEASRAEVSTRIETEALAAGRKA